MASPNPLPTAAPTPDAARPAADRSAAAGALPRLIWRELTEEEQAERLAEIDRRVRSINRNDYAAEQLRAAEKDSDDIATICGMIALALLAVGVIAVLLP